MKGCSVLVTGATGFIGNALVKKLVNMNARVTCLVRSAQKNNLLLRGINILPIESFSTT